MVDVGLTDWVQLTALIVKTPKIKLLVIFIFFVFSQSLTLSAIGRIDKFRYGNYIPSMTHFVKSLSRVTVAAVLSLLVPHTLKADDTAKTMDALSAEMVKVLAPLKKVEGWTDFIASHPDLFGKVDEQNPNPFLAVSDMTLKVGEDEFKIGIGARSIWIAATPKVVVQVVDNPHIFTALYGLDKPADIYPINSDGSFQAHIFKLVPGIETQDYTLSYKGFWSGDNWIQEASQVKDEKGFALRENIKIVSPNGKGALFREVSLLYPRRWWVRLLHGTAQSIFKKELGKLNRSLKCTAEKVQTGSVISDDLARQCLKESQN